MLSQFNHPTAYFAFERTVLQGLEVPPNGREERIDQLATRKRWWPESSTRCRIHFSHIANIISVKDEVTKFDEHMENAVTDLLYRLASTTEGASAGIQVHCPSGIICGSLCKSRQCIIDQLQRDCIVAISTYWMPSVKPSKGQVPNHPNGDL